MPTTSSRSKSAPLPAARAARGHISSRRMVASPESPRVLACDVPTSEAPAAIGDPARFGLLPDGASPLMPSAELAAVLGTSIEALKVERAKARAEGRPTWLPRAFTFGHRRGLFYLRADVASMLRPVGAEVEGEA